MNLKLRNFRVGLRILVRNPAYSLVGVLGLGLGLAACLLLLGFVRYSWQYDAHVPDADNVYVVKQRNNLDLAPAWQDQSPLLLRGAASTTPGVTNASGYVNWLPLTVDVNGQLRKLRSLTVLPGFAGLMGLRAVKGNLEDALSRPDSFVITEEAALRLFGTTEVLGRTIHLSTLEAQGGAARIGAVVPSPPSNTTIPFDTLNGVNLTLLPQMLRTEALTGAQGWLGNLLVRVRPGTSPEAVAAALQQAVDRAPALQKAKPELKARLGGRKALEIELSPLRDAYFDRDLAANRFSRQVERGDARIVAALAAIALLVPALAAINYANLATIRVIRRQREIGMRKVLGAGTGHLAWLFVAESLLVSTLATGIGLLLAWLALPVFGTLVNRDLSNVLTPANAAAGLGLGLALGLLTAIHPAWIALRVRPSHALAGQADTESTRGKRLRHGLTALQLAAAMGLAGYTLAVALQTQFALTASPGFDPSSLLVFELDESQTVRFSREAQALMAALARQPSVAGVAVSGDPVGRAKNRWSTDISREGGAAVTMDIKPVSANFFEEYGIKAAAGRLFDSALDKENDPVPVVINELAARKLGFASAAQAVGQTVLFRGFNGALTAKRVVGIAPEVRFYSLRDAPLATAYELSTEGATLTVRASGPVADAERAIRALWPTYFPRTVLELQAARDIYAANYADDARLSKLLAAATAIALMIAACGTYVLAADAVVRRTREIALRKLYGARRRDIGKLVAREVGGIVLLSAAVALPLAALAVARYLSTYAERSPVGYWPLALALLVTAGTAAAAVARQAWVAMVLKPAAALQA
jgi:hypothetical protein